jgi:hypothetical protein
MARLRSSVPRRFGRSKSGAKPMLSNGKGKKKWHRTATTHAQKAKRVIDPARWFSLLRVPEDGDSGRPGEIHVLREKSDD